MVGLNSRYSTPQVRGACSAFLRWDSVWSFLPKTQIPGVLPVSLILVDNDGGALTNRVLLFSRQNEHLENGQPSYSFYMATKMAYFGGEDKELGGGGLFFAMENWVWCVGGEMSSFSDATMHWLPPEGLVVWSRTQCHSIVEWFDPVSHFCLGKVSWLCRTRAGRSQHLLHVLLWGKIKKIHVTYYSSLTENFISTCVIHFSYWILALFFVSSDSLFLLNTWE